MACKTAAQAEKVVVNVSNDLTFIRVTTDQMVMVTPEEAEAIIETQRAYDELTRGVRPDDYTDRSAYLEARAGVSARKAKADAIMSMFLDFMETHDFYTSAFHAQFERSKDGTGDNVLKNYTSPADLREITKTEARVREQDGTTWADELLARLYGIC